MATIGQLILLTNGTGLEAASGFLPCDGRAVKQSDYPALYNVIGTSFGATTNDDFKLPGANPLPAGLKSPASYYICTNGTDPSLPAPDAVIGRVERFGFQPTLPLPAGWDRPANQQTLPSNYHPCDGSSLQVTQNPDLFSLIGNWNYLDKYIPVTFSLPNVPTDPNFYWGMPHNGYCIATEGIYPIRPTMPSDDDFVGQIILMPGSASLDLRDYEGSRVLPCSGETLVITGYEALLAIIGFTYGGNEIYTFALPNLSPPPGLENYMYFIVTDGVFPAGD